MRRLQDNFLPTAGLATAVAILLFFEWHTDEPLVVLPVLLLISFVAGGAAPRSFVLSGLILGFAILVAHAASSATGVMIPRYQKEPPSTSDWAVMALLVLPSLGAAFAGSSASRLFRRSRAH
jgi:hypothetical protein